MSLSPNYYLLPFSHTHQVFTVADARRTLEGILAQEAADKKKRQEEALEHCRRQPAPVGLHSRTEMSYESEEEIIPEATPSTQHSALAPTKMSRKPIEGGSAQSESTLPRHADMHNRWLRWGFWSIVAILLLLVADSISTAYEAPSRHPRLHGAKDHETRTFIYHTAFPQHITSRRDILHDFRPSSEPPSAVRIDVDSMKVWSCSGTGSLHLDRFSRHFLSENAGHHDIISDVLYCPNFPEPDHISAAQVGKGGSGLRFQDFNPGSRLFDEDNPVVPYVTLTGAHGGHRAAIDDQSRVTFTAYVRAPDSQLSRLIKRRKRLVDHPFRWYTGRNAARDDLGSNSN